MKKLRPYRGYTATVELDRDETVLHGRLDDIRDVITFHAPAGDDPQQKFEAAVDDYLAFCEERGESPAMPGEV